MIGVISLWTTAVFPYLTRRVVAGRKALQRDVSRATGVAIVLAVALIALIVPVGRAFMVELFGVAYVPAAPAFIILDGNGERRPRKRHTHERLTGNRGGTPVRVCGHGGRDREHSP